MMKTVMLLFFALSICDTIPCHKLDFQINSKESLIALQVVLEFKTKGDMINAEEGNETLITVERGTFRGDLQVAYHVACWLSSCSNNVNLFGNNYQQVEMIDLWFRMAINKFSNSNKFNSSMQELDSALKSRNFLVRDKLTYADIAVWAELKRANNWQNSLENNQTTFNNVRSWYESLTRIPQFQLSF